MNRTTIIEGIISKRKEKQGRIIQRLNSVVAIADALRELQQCSEDLQGKLTGEQKEKAGSELCFVNEKIKEADDTVEKLRGELRRLKNRTQRDTLNIGIVGRPKQGKSTFLQALTGLDEAIIPTGNDFVTGACSYLRHDSTLTSGEAYAIVTPYSHKEFLDEVLKPFCKCFNLGLNSVDDLPQLRLPDTRNMNETQKRLLERFEKLQSDFGSYKELLGQPTRQISKNEIRRYVAQCDEECKSKYTFWYAIKKAEIHCRFPQDDIGSIMICDTPGLGDFTPGAQKALMEKLSSDMDVVFFMKRLIVSDQTISEPDTAFHDVIKDANPHIDVSDWAYMILNCNESEEPSARFCEDLRDKLPTRKGALPLNARNEASVSDCFKDILQDIVGQIPKIDEKLEKSYGSLEEDVQNALRAVIDAAKKVTVVKAPSGSRLNSELTKEVLDNLFKKFKEFKNELKENRHISIAPEISEIINKMRSQPPQFNFSERAQSQPGACYFDGKNMLRARFISEFSNLDITMEKIISSARQRLQEVLTSNDGGRLSFVLDNEHGDFWANLRESIMETLSEDDARHLILAIDNVTNLRMNFRAFILPRLTEITNGLSNDVLPPESPFLRFAYNQLNDDYETCMNKLNAAWACAVGMSEELFDDEEGDMKDVNTSPAAAIIALVEEFELLWFYYNGKDVAESILREFYEKHQNEAWPELDSDASIFKISKQWKKSVDRFTKVVENFTIKQ